MNGQGKEVLFSKLLESIEKNSIIKAIVFTFDMPRISSHIQERVRKQLGFEKKPVISRHLVFLEKRKIIKTLTLKLRPGSVGRVYGLSNIGIEVRKLLCAKYNIPFEYYCPGNVDWQDYGWAVSGSEKRALFRAMSTEAKRNVEIHELTKQFYTTRKEKVKGMSRQHVNDLLQEGIKRKIFSVEKEERRRKKTIVRYKLSNKGMKIKEVMEKDGLFQ